MYVCICAAVTDQEVAAAVEGGATSVEAVTRVCGAGGDCGACQEAIEEAIDARWGDDSQAPRRLPLVAERAA